MKHPLILGILLGYVIMITYVASNLVKENQKLTFDLNVTQAALIIAKSPYFIQHSPYCSDSWVLR